MASELQSDLLHSKKRSADEFETSALDDQSGKKSKLLTEPASVGADPHIELRLLTSCKEAGAIIGRGGAHVNSIFAQTGIRIRISSDPISPTADRLVVIEGELASVKAAAALALSSIQPDANGQVSLMVLLANEAMPFVRGKRGDLVGSQGDLEQVIGSDGRVSASVSSTLMSDSTERSMTLQGPRARVQWALDLISAALEQFMKHGDHELWVKYTPPTSRGMTGSGSSLASLPSSSYSSFNSRHQPAALPYPMASSASFHTAAPRGHSSMPSFSVPAGSVSSNSSEYNQLAHSFAGKGIQSQEAMQVALTVQPLASSICGTSTLIPGVIQVELCIPHASAGSIIGRGGSMISEIIKQSGAQVKIDEAQTATQRVVRVYGQISCVQLALQLLSATLMSDPYFLRLQAQLASGVPVATSEFTIPEACIGAIFGKKGANISEIQRVTGTIIRTSERSANATASSSSSSSSSLTASASALPAGHRQMFITGTASAQQSALSLIQQSVASETHSLTAFVESQAIPGSLAAYLASLVQSSTASASAASSLALSSSTR